MFRRPRLTWLGLPLALASGAVLAQTPAANRRTPAPATAPATPPADAGRSPEEQQRRAQVVARVGETEITVGELEDMLNEAPPPVRQAYVDVARRREFLENMVQTILLADEARRRGIDRAPDIASSIRRILAQRLLQSAVLEAVTMDSISDAEVAQYYQEHVGDYQIPEQRRATVIFLDDRASAEQVAQQARAARGDMRRIQQLARERSTDPATREQGGDLFYFRRTGGAAGGASAVDPAISAAAFALGREMEVGGPVQTANGKWAVVVLTGIRPALSRTLRDPGVANSIRGYLVRERRTQREQQLLAELRARMNPEVHEDRLDQLRLPQSDLGNVPPFEQQGAPRRPETPGASPVPPPAPR
jgi:hypothetical protein